MDQRRGQAGRSQGGRESSPPRGGEQAKRAGGEQADDVQANVL